MNKLKKTWQEYGLSITLCALFLTSWFAQGIFQWQEFTANAHQHDQSPQMIEFLPEFFSATFENWQSEFLQLFTFVVLATWLVHKDSPQSRDGDDAMRAQLNRIESRLRKLQ